MDEESNQSDQPSVSEESNQPDAVVQDLSFEEDVDQNETEDKEVCIESKIDSTPWKWFQMTSFFKNIISKKSTM